MCYSTLSSPPAQLFWPGIDIGGASGPAFADEGPALLPRQWRRGLLLLCPPQRVKCVVSYNADKMLSLKATCVQCFFLSPLITQVLSPPYQRLSALWTWALEPRGNQDGRFEVTTVRTPTPSRAPCCPLSLPCCSCNTARRYLTSSPTNPG